MGDPSILEKRLDEWRHMDPVYLERLLCDMVPVMQLMTFSRTPL
jgi:hypothetical protein